MTSTAAPVDVTDLASRVQEVYRSVAEHPDGSYHFELGRELAQRLGYPTDLLDRIPTAALESFAGVGYFVDLAAPVAGTACSTWAADRAPTSSPPPPWSARPATSSVST
jgi:arsenite methyltransferase